MKTYPGGTHTRNFKKGRFQYHHHRYRRRRGLFKAPKSIKSLALLTFHR